MLPHSHHLRITSNVCLLMSAFPDHSSSSCPPNYPSTQRYFLLLLCLIKLRFIFILSIFVDVSMICLFFLECKLLCIYKHFEVHVFLETGYILEVMFERISDANFWILLYTYILWIPYIRAKNFIHPIHCSLLLFYIFTFLKI